MKYLKLILFAALIQFTFTGCSYVSDMVEGAITKRASFTVEAVNNGSNVILTWSKTDTSSDFAGIEIYRTRYANDEYSGYITIEDRWTDGSLGNGTTGTYTAPLPPSGVYFYRVGFIHWDEAEVDRTSANGYDEPWDDPLNIENNYNSHTDIDEISGSARVEIN